MATGLRRPRRQRWCLSALLATIAVAAGCLQDCSAQSSSTSQTNAVLVLTSIGFAGAIADANVREVTVRGDNSQAVATTVPAMILTACAGWTVLWSHVQPRRRAPDDGCSILCSWQSHQLLAMQVLCGIV